MTCIAILTNRCNNCGKCVADNLLTPMEFDYIFNHVLMVADSDWPGRKKIFDAAAQTCPYNAISIER